jgi:hypothetical protein
MCIKQPPTEKIEKQWQALLRQLDLMHKMKVAQKRKLIEDEREKDSMIQKKPM